MKLTILTGVISFTLLKFTQASVFPSCFNCFKCDREDDSDNCTVVIASSQLNNHPESFHNDLPVVAPVDGTSMNTTNSDYNISELVTDLDSTDGSVADATMSTANPDISGNN